jgi:hypothetical protein
VYEPPWAGPYTFLPSRRSTEIVRGGFVRHVVCSVVGVVVLICAASAFAARDATGTVRLVKVKSPVARGKNGHVVATVYSGSPSCSIRVTYKSGPAQAKGLSPERADPSTGGRLVWTWKVGTKTRPGRSSIRISCGSAGSFRTHFMVVR